MTRRIEMFFGLGLVLAIVAALLFAFFKTKGTDVATYPTSTINANGTATAGTVPTRTPVNAGGSSSMILTGNTRSDLCSCYEQAFVYGSQGFDISSTHYETGYGLCKNAQGTKGAQAWSYGWANGTTGNAAKRSCKIYLSSIR